jgi:hypothetical protein
MTGWLDGLSALKTWARRIYDGILGTEGVEVESELVACTGA